MKESPCIGLVFKERLLVGSLQNKGNFDPEVAMYYKFINVRRH